MRRCANPTSVCVRHWGRYNALPSSYVASNLVRCGEKMGLHIFPRNDIHEVIDLLSNGYEIHVCSQDDRLIDDFIECVAKTLARYDDTTVQNYEVLLERICSSAVGNSDPEQSICVVEITSEVHLQVHVG